MFRFTIRDVLWLRVVVAVHFAWHRSYENMRLRLDLSEFEKIEALNYLDEAHAALDEAGIELPQPGVLWKRRK